MTKSGFVPAVALVLTVCVVSTAEAQRSSASRRARSCREPDFFWRGRQAVRRHCRRLFAVRLWTVNADPKRGRTTRSICHAKQNQLFRLTGLALGDELDAVLPITQR
jgi:hypothetical protein